MKSSAELLRARVKAGGRPISVNVPSGGGAGQQLAKASRYAGRRFCGARNVSLEFPISASPMLPQKAS